MVDRGARNLMFVSRRGASSPRAAEITSALEQRGVRVSILQCDVADENKFNSELSNALTTTPPLRGVINSAMDLNDSIFTNMSHEKFAAGLRPKVQGSWNLHQATQGMPLDFFVMLSSSAAFFGSIAQGNYAAGCTYQVALAAHRRSLGLPAVSIDVGKVVEVGHVVEESAGTSMRNLTQLGVTEIREAELLCLIEMAMRPSESDIKTAIPNGHLLTGIHSSNDPSKGVDLPFWNRDPVFSHMDFVRPYLRKVKKTEAEAGTSQKPLPEALRSASSVEEAEALLLEGILKKLARALMMPIEDLDPKKDIATYGVDSLVAVDLRNWLTRDAGVNMPVFEILRPVPLSTLAKHAVAKSALVNL